MHRLAARIVLIPIGLVISNMSYGQVFDTGTNAVTRSQSIEFANQINQLSSDSYQTRLQATEQLMSDARKDSESSLTILAMLRSVECVPEGFHDLEGSIARRRIAQQLQERADAMQLDAFLYDDEFQAEQMVGWKGFKQSAGDDLAARLLFAEAIQSNPQFGEELQRLQLSGKSPTVVPEVIHSIRRDDVLSWAMLLSMTSMNTPTDEVSFAIVSTLRCYGTGPLPQREAQQRVIRRLVESYLSKSDADLRDKIYIGTRFQCVEPTESWCREVLDDSEQTPSRIVTALLSASAIGLPDSEIDRWLEAYRHDERVSHVWRSMDLPGITHRTQIRDVALAIWLHRQSVDPRKNGFHSLIADPVLVFRAYSLGFPTSIDRDESHQMWQ